MISLFLKYFNPILRNKIFFLIASLLFWLALEVGYRVFVNKYFEYAGFTMTFSIKYWEALVIFFVLTYISPTILKKPSDFLIIIFLFGFITPVLVFYSLADQERIHLYIILLGYVITNFLRNGKIYKLPSVKQGKEIALSILFFGPLIVTLWFIFSGAINNINLDIRKVYELRTETGVIINTKIMGYLNFWSYKVFGPILISFFIWKKKYNLLILICLLHIFWFSISGNRAIIFFPILIVFFWIFFLKNNSLSIIPVLLSSVIFISLLVFFMYDNFLFPSLFIRRTFFSPAFLTFTYYDFFSVREFVYWSNSITASFINYPYNLYPAKLIGDYLETNGHANTSFLATGFMHAGLFGVVFYSILVGYLLRLIDSMGKNYTQILIAVSAIIVPFNSLVKGADLPTALFSHGIIVGIIILFLLKNLKN